MARKSYWLLVALVTLAGTAATIAQQTQGTPPTGSLPAAAASQPANPPAIPGSPQAPASAPAPSYPQPPGPESADRPQLSASSAPQWAVPAQKLASNAPPESGYPPAQAHVNDQVAPYHVHRDTRHGHDHVYPDRGSVVREVPRAGIVVNYAGLSYRFHDGVWFEPRGPAFIVVVPPIGLVVPSLPGFATSLATGGEAYLYANDVYYRARPDIGGYEVVNDPTSGAREAGGPPVTAAASATGGPASVPVAPVAAVSASPAVATPAVGSVAPATASSAMTPATAVAASPALAVLPAGWVAPATASASMTPVASAQPAAPGPGAPFAGVPAAAGATTPAAADAAAGLQVSRPTRVFAYPRNGQTADQQVRDQYECYRFAVAQSGFDPLRANGAVSGVAASERQSDYERAQAACFDARGYTIR